MHIMRGDSLVVFEGVYLIIRRIFLSNNLFNKRLKIQSYTIRRFSSFIDIIIFLVIEFLSIKIPRIIFQEIKTTKESPQL